MADLSIQQDILQKVEQHDITAGAVNETTAFGTDFRLCTILVHRVGTGGNQNFEVFFNSGTNSVNDTILLSESIGNNGELFYAPDYDVYFKSGDEITYTFPTVGPASSTLNVTVTAVQA